MSVSSLALVSINGEGQSNVLLLPTKHFLLQGKSGGERKNEDEKHGNGKEGIKRTKLN